MADAVATQIIQDAARNAILKFTNISDGTGESAVLKVDVSALVGAPDKVSIKKIHYANNGMSVRILFDATTDVFVIELPQNHAETLDFCDFNGIPNTLASGYTGDILFTTVGHSSGDSYTVILELVK